MISAVILGFLQGLTEFLPISSSGHLIVVRDILGINIEGALLFDVLLHLATALAIIVYFRKDIGNMIVQPMANKVLWLAIILGTIPAAVFGLFLTDSIRNSQVVALTLILGSILFLVAEKFAKQNQALSVKKGIVIGIFQALALIPGLSRSGATISGGLLLGMKRDEAAKFSFFLGIPAILGAGILSSINYFEVLPGSLNVSLIVGAFVAFITGLFAIHYLLKFLRSYKLTVFAWYRVVLALLILIFV